MELSTEAQAEAYRSLSDLHHKETDDSFDKLGDQETDSEMKCGYGQCTPHWLQRFNSSRALLAAVSWFAFVQNLVVNGIVFVNIATIERRFELSSKQVALLPVSYELSAGFCALIFGFLGIFMHIGKILTFGALCLSAGSFVSFLPHLLAGSYQLGKLSSGQCSADGGEIVECTEATQGANYVSLFVIGQILHGVGGGAIFTLGSPYMDENIRTENTPLYIGLMQMFAMFGPALGFMGGGLLLTRYVDFTRVDMSQITLTPSDPRWVGAWWIAYLVTGVAGVTVALFMACFPRQLAKTKELKKTRKSLAHHKGSGEGGGGDHGDHEDADKDTAVSEMLRVQCSFLRHLATNPIWVLLTICATVETGAIIGFATFMPKMLQFQFSLTSTTAALLSGAIFIPGAAGGVLLGGLTPKWLKSEVRGLLGQCLVCSMAVLLLSFAFLVRCQSTPFAGITQPYIASDSNVSSVTAELSLTHACNANCSCSTVIYEPVCGVNGVQYFSSCHAGCVTVVPASDNNNTKLHLDCRCIVKANGSALYAMSRDVGANVTQRYQAVDGPCASNCNLLYVFLPLFFLVILLIFFSVPANQAATLRCVPDRQRAFAFGIQDFFLRYFGNVLGPLILGTVFDMSCALWQEDCGHRGSCWVYDGRTLALGFLVLGLCVKVISTISYLLAIFLYRPPPPHPPPASASSKPDADATDSLLLTPVSTGEAGDCDRHSDSVEQCDGGTVT